MSLRQIVVVSSTRSTPLVLRSEAETWGQLKDALSNQSLGDLKNMRVVIKESKITLELDEAILPDEDFTLFLSAKQIKAGNTDVIAVLERLKEEFTDSIDNIIEDINNGEYVKAEPKAYSTTPKVSYEDREFLASLGGR